jgi:hypothetical protein
MSNDSTGWKIVGLLVALLTLAVPTYVAYDQFDRGPSAEKRVQLSRLGLIDPLRDLSGLGDKVALSLKVEDEILDNIVVVQALFSNIGQAPIVPSDYHENLSVTVSDPWKIIEVETRSRMLTKTIPLRWQRISDTRFEAEPALLNPGDTTFAAVYLTDTDPSSTTVQDRPEPKVEWNARITNLRDFYEPPDLFERMKDRLMIFGVLGLQIHLQGWAVVFTATSALLFLAAYLHLLSRAGFFCDWGWRPICLILGASILSFAAGESSSTYLFGSPTTDAFGVKHWLNAPPIALNALALALLYLYHKSRARAESLLPPSSSPER